MSHPPGRPVASCLRCEVMTAAGGRITIQPWLKRRGSGRRAAAKSCPAAMGSRWIMRARDEVGDRAHPGAAKIFAALGDKGPAIVPPH